MKLKMKLFREESKEKPALTAKRISVSLARAPVVTAEMRSRMEAAAKRRNDNGQYAELREITL